MLRRDVIPALVDAGQRDFRAWSAGCSSGEEPYTLAMLVVEHLEQAGRVDTIGRTRIEATDIDRACLERARAAVYRRELLSELPPELTGAYFQPAGADLQVVERARRLVAFTELDLSRQRPLRRDYHLILCRNVVIYFDRATQNQLVKVGKMEKHVKGFAPIYVGGEDWYTALSFVFDYGGSIAKFSHGKWHGTLTRRSRSRG